MSADDTARVYAPAGGCARLCAISAASRRSRQRLRSAIRSGETSPSHAATTSAMFAEVNASEPAGEVASCA